MVKVGVQTKGILPEMGIEDGVAIIAGEGFEMVDFNLDTFLKNSDVYGGKINKFFDADIEDILAYFGEYKKMFNKYGIKLQSYLFHPCMDGVLPEFLQSRLPEDYSQGKQSAF